MPAHRLRTIVFRFNFLVLLFCSLPAYPEDLIDIYRLAKQSDPEYLSAKNNFIADKQKLPQARALLLPDISATAYKSRSDDKTTVDPDPTLKSGTSGFEQSGYRVSLRQPLYNGASFAALKQAQATVRKAVADFGIAEQSLVKRAALAYFNSLKANDDLDLATSEKTATRRQLDLASARLEVGLATITEVHEARARYELTEAQEIEAINQQEDTIEQLRRLTGQEIRNLEIIGKEDILRPIGPQDIDMWVKQSLETNLALIAAKADLEIAQQKVRVQRAGHYPTLDIVGNSSVSDATGSSSFSVSLPDSSIRRENKTIGLELNLPLFQGGLVNALTKEANLRFKAAQYNLEQVRRQVIRDTRSSFRSLASGMKKITALKQAVIAGESALEAKSEGFKAGINTNQDVLYAQRDVFLAKRDHADAVYTYVLDLFQFKETTGTLNQNDLLLISER
jgi:outer membrane protein